MAGGRFCFQLLLHELMAVIILISKRMAAIALGFLLLHSGLIILGDVGGIVQRHCPEKERHALISFKRELIDDFGMLSSWATHHDDVHNKNCCDWRGVLCNYSTGHVIALQLPGSIQNPLSPGPVLRRLGGNIASSLLELEHLKHLDLSFNYFDGILPNFMGSLAKLEYLNLSRNLFSGTLLYQLGNLSNLRTLDLEQNNGMYFANLEWLSHLHLLRYLDLSYVNLSTASDWQQAILNLPSLTHLYLERCQLISQVLHPSIASDHVNSSHSLVFLSLSHNYLNSSFIYAWEELFNSSHSSLEDVDLSDNGLHDQIPKAFGRLCKIKSLSLAMNQLSQKLSGLFQTLFVDGCGGNSSSLEMLDLRGNHLSGSLPNLARFSSLSYLYLTKNQLNESFPQDFGFPSSLLVLNLSYNQIVGPLPKLMACSSLVELYLANNHMNGTIPKDLGSLSQLEILDVSSNSFEGMMSEAHFSRLSKLQYLDLSHNTLTLNLSFDWVPPFQLDFILLIGCKLGPHFPEWLRNQNKYAVLDISSAAISDTIPNWFWDQSPGLYYLNLSHNHITAGLLIHPHFFVMKEQS